MGGASSKFNHSLNDYELAIKASKQMEHILASEFDAEGNGLHVKVTSVRHELPQEVVSNLRYLASIRNDLVHRLEVDKIPDREMFIHKLEGTAARLEEIVEQRRRDETGGYGGCVFFNYVSSRSEDSY